jgi:hypothetical protein
MWREEVGGGCLLLICLRVGVFCSRGNVSVGRISSGKIGVDALFIQRLGLDGEGLGCFVCFVVFCRWFFWG